MLEVCDLILPHEERRAVLRTELVTDPEGLRDLESDWRRFAEERGNIFVTPEWYSACLRHYCVSHRPYVIVVRDDDGRLVGLIPLVSRATRRRSVLRFAGANLGDHFHPVCPTHAEDEVAVAAAAELARRRRDWKALALHNVDVGARWPALLAGEGSAPLAAVRDRPFPLPYARLDGVTWEEFLAARSRWLRKELRKDLRGLGRGHAVRFRRTSDPQELDTDLDRFFALHLARWAGRGHTTLASTQAQTFLRDLAAGALRAGWLRLWSLEVDDQAVAAWMGWRLGGRYASYQSGFDPAWSRHSVGLLLLAHTVREAIEEGAAEYDFLLGDEPYKQRFASGARTVHTIVATPVNSPLRLLAAADLGLRRATRALPPGLRSRLARATNPILRRLPSSRQF